MAKYTIFFYLFALSFSAQGQTADFTFRSSNGLFCAPAVIEFTQTSTGSPTGFLWDFGNNTGSNLPNPVIGYSVAGVYTVKLAVLYPTTTISVTKTVTVNPSIVASIGIDRPYICTPGTVNFTTFTNGNNTTKQWDFGDGSGIITTTSNTISHNYTAFGEYNATLKVTDINGCFVTGFQHVSVAKPTITATVSPASGCIPANANFSANVTLPVSGSVTNYTWNFGDAGPAVITTVNNTVHSYTVVGSYSPTLNIVSNEGCTNTFNFPAVAYGTPPTNHIAYPKKTSICGSETAMFVSKATNANSYFWNFGDGNTITVNDTLASHKYTTLGTKTVTATPLFNGCAGTPISFTIDVIGVIAGYNYANSCSSPKQYSFTNTSQGNLSTITWNFGDATGTLNTTNAVHTFPPVGTFTTTLTVTDNITGCSDEYSKQIYTADPGLVNPDSSICKNSNTHFSITNNYNNPNALYTWHVAGQQIGPTSDPILSVNANILGNYNNNYVVINNGAQSCPDTIILIKPLLVRGPQLSFTSQDSICFKTPYVVTNTSQPFVPGDSIKIWYWNFGVTIYNDSVYQPQPYTGYPHDATWNVNLVGIDINGCRDSLHKYLVVKPTPFLYTIPGTDTLCLGQPDTLIALHNNNLSWSPAGAVSCQTCDTIIVNPSINTTYYATASNSFNCSSKDSVVVKVFTPFTAVAAPANLYACTNETVQLNVSPPDKLISWSPAAGLSDAGIYNPSASPETSTIYTATLSDSVGCFTSTATVNVHVKSLPNVDAGPDIFSAYNANFTLTPVYGNNITSYLWEPATTLSCADCPTPSGVASETQQYSITVTSDSGCIAKDQINVFVECKYANLLLPSAFTPNNDNLNDYFYPITRGIKTVMKFLIYDRRGQLVFEAKDILPNNRLSGWNGELKGTKQGMGSYVYYLEAVCDAGGVLTKKGTVLLIR